VETFEVERELQRNLAQAGVLPLNFLGAIPKLQVVDEHLPRLADPSTAGTMKQSASLLLSNAFTGLRISPISALRPALTSQSHRPTTSPPTQQRQHGVRPFSSTPAQLGSWLEPSIDRKQKMMKGRARCPTGGSSRGTTVIWGDYGLRMSDHHRRISAKQLKVAEDTIKQRLRGQKYRLYKRVACNIGVFVSGNEVCLNSVWIGSLRI
jgi:hypothetical protein